MEADRDRSPPARFGVRSQPPFVGSVRPGTDCNDVADRSGSAAISRKVTSPSPSTIASRYAAGAAVEIEIKQRRTGRGSAEHDHAAGTAALDLAGDRDQRGRRPHIDGKSDEIGIEGEDLAHIARHVVAAEIDELDLVSGVLRIADDRGLDAADAVAWKLEG